MVKHSLENLEHLDVEGNLASPLEFDFFRMMVKRDVKEFHCHDIEVKISRIEQIPSDPQGNLRL